MPKPSKLKENVPLASLTTLGIGGNARLFIRAETETEVAEAIEFSEMETLEVFVLGGGSNVFISDAGFDGLVLQIALGGTSTVEKTETIVHVTAAAGEDWDPLVARCIREGLAGIECLSGIPGFVGGTPVQNVGAYGQEVSETIVSVRCFDRGRREFVTLANADCGFSYRSSIFNSTHRDRYIVLSVVYALTPGGEPKVVYRDLLDHFAGKLPSLAEVREAVLTIRRKKSMVIDPADPNSRSAGSFFKNPIIDTESLESIQAHSEHVPWFEVGDKVKIPAAWLIEQAGFHKGFVLGEAGISANHTLALINRGRASADEILKLKGEIQAAVEAAFGIMLEPEPVFVGF